MVPVGGWLHPDRGATCVSCPCCPTAAILGTVVMIFPAVPCVIILVVRMVMGLLEPGGRGSHSQLESFNNRQSRVCGCSTCSTLEGGHGDGLDDGGPRFGGCWGNTQDGGLGWRGAGLHGAEEGGLLPIC